MILTVEPFPGDYCEKQSLRETEERARSLGTASWDGTGPNPEKFNENLFETASRLSTTTRENVLAVNSMGLRCARLPNCTFSLADDHDPLPDS